MKMTHVTALNAAGVTPVLEPLSGGRDSCLDVAASN